ncbi:MAG: rane protein [Bacillales bacterium]|nr:rane protein [Bacillales bacterium]
MNDKILELEQRIESIEKRLDKLENHDGISTAVKNVEKESIKPIRNEFEEELQKIRATTKRIVTTPKIEKKKIEWDKELGQVWLPRIFMGLLIIGVLWGFKATADYGLITDPMKIILSYIGVLVLYILGNRQFTKNRPKFGIVMLGGAVALGIITTFAAHYIFNYINETFAFVFNVGFAASGIYLSNWHKSQMLSIFSTIGLFLTPFLVQSNEPNTIIFSLYILAVFLSMFYLSVNWKHKIALYIQFGLFHSTYFAYSTLSGIDNSETTILVYGVVVQHLFVLYLILKDRVENLGAKWKVEGFIYTNFIALFLWMQTQEAFITRIIWFSLLVIYIYICVSLLKSKRKTWNISIETRQKLFGVISAVTVFIGALFIDSFKLTDTKTIIYLLEGTIALYIGISLKQYRTIITGSLIYGLTIFYIQTLILEDFMSIEALYRILVMISIFIIGRLVIKYILESLKSNADELSAVFIVPQIYFGLVGAEFIRVLDEKYIPTFESLYIYMIYFIIVAICSFKLRMWKYGYWVSNLGLGLIILLCLNIINIPLSYESNNTFLLYFLVQVLMILTLGYFIRESTMKSKVMKIPTDIKRLLVQIVILVFLNKYFFAFFDQFEIFGEWRYVWHSFLLFVFALVSIYISKTDKGKYVLIVGWILLASTLLKLLFIDLAETSISVRAILFIVIGLIGVIYSKTFYTKKKEDKK